MKTFVIALILFPAALAAQTQTKFSISGKALGFSAGGTGVAAADAVSAVQISPNLTVRNDNIILSDPSSPSIAAFELGGAQYDLPLSGVLKKTFLDPAKYKLYAVAEGGIVTSSLGQSPAASAGIGLNYYPQSAPAVVINLFEARWINGRVPVSAARTATNGIAVSIGLTFK
ncbi:MAG TPA: hypothetical protein VFC10_07390 [Terriglobia bacterium]|jgi:hypothetical protein|nr:hypothetical protein [Terracidiphilus sp.]HZT69557.1 hypothetical protein [Terriglobia bacterium]